MPSLLIMVTVGNRGVPDGRGQIFLYGEKILIGL